MEANNMNLHELKKMRLERHWSQEQLAVMAGLSIRTIQRIENGEKAGLESIKALAAVFETNLIVSDEKKEREQIKKEEAYVQHVKGFYKLIFIAVLSLIVPLYLALNDTKLWSVFIWSLVSWGVILLVYSYKAFDFFGKNWEQKIIDKKFKKNQ